MAQRQVLTGLVVAAAASGLWLLLRTEEAASPVRQQAPVARASAGPPAVAATSTVVRDEAPAAAAPAPAEFDRDEWPAVQRALAPGELEGIVLRGRQPLTGVRVRVWERGAGRLGQAADRGLAVHEGLTDAQGRVRFERVAGGDFVLRADHDGRHVEAPGRVPEAAGAASSERTVVLLFGTASIVGSVRDDAGAPRAGVPVYVSRLQMPCAVATITDARGTFEFAGLYGGRWHVQLEQTREQWSAANERMLTLRTGERARMDFGGPQPAGSLRGRIVDAEGGAVHGERPLRVRHVVHNDERRLHTDDKGEFTIALPPGRWDLLTAGDWFGTAVLASADVDRDEVRADVVWRGIRVVAIANVLPGVDAARLKECLTLKSDDAGWLQSDAAFVADGQTIVQWLGVPEGRYLLQIGNGLYFTDAPNTGIHVHVSAACVQRVLVNVRR